MQQRDPKTGCFAPAAPRAEPFAFRVGRRPRLCISTSERICCFHRRPATAERRPLLRARRQAAERERES
eukprot:4758272-Pyramimonas_sp.AAC.1